MDTMYKQDNCLIIRSENEKMVIESWGKNGASKPGWRSHLPSVVKVWLAMSTVGWMPEESSRTACDSGSE